MYVFYRYSFTEEFGWKKIWRVFQVTILCSKAYGSQVLFVPCHNELSIHVYVYACKYIPLILNRLSSCLSASYMLSVYLPHRWRTVTWHGCGKVGGGAGNTTLWMPAGASTWCWVSQRRDLRSHVWPRSMIACGLLTRWGEKVISFRSLCSLIVCTFIYLPVHHQPVYHTAPNLDQCG